MVWWKKLKSFESASSLPHSPTSPVSYVSLRHGGNKISTSNNHLPESSINLFPEIKLLAYTRVYEIPSFGLDATNIFKEHDVVHIKNDK